MVVVMLCGNVVEFPSSVLDTTRTLTATIALELGYAFADHRAALFGISLLLLSGVLCCRSAIQLLNSRE